MADNKNIVDDVLSKGIFGKVATKYTSRASKEEVVKEAVEELPPVVEQPEPVTVEPEPAVIEQVIAVKPVKVNLVKNVYNKGAFRDIASMFVKGTLVKMIDPNKEIKITEEKEVVTKEAIEELPTVVKQPESVPAGLKVGGNLYLYDTQITSLPAGLKVGGNLFLENTPIAKQYTREQIKQMYPGIKGHIYT